MEKIEFEIDGVKGTGTKVELGGFIIPRTAYIDVVKAGHFWSYVRWAGQRILNFGAWFRALGYEQKEIHPYDEIIKNIKG